MFPPWGFFVALDERLRTFTWSACLDLYRPKAEVSSVWQIKQSLAAEGANR
jgi:hypothetical protein